VRTACAFKPQIETAAIKRVVMVFFMCVELILAKVVRILNVYYVKHNFISMHY
jgi:hypothetical protein